MGQPESDWLGNCLLFSGILSFSSDYDFMVKALLGRRRTGGAGWFGAQLLFRNCNGHCCRGLHTEADDTKQAITRSACALGFSGCPTLRDVGEGWVLSGCSFSAFCCFRISYRRHLAGAFLAVALLFQSEIPNFKFWNSLSGDFPPPTTSQTHPTKSNLNSGVNRSSGISCQL